MERKYLLLLVVPMVLLVASCAKRDMYYPPVDKSQWLRKEKAYVVASDYSCDYYAVETARGYALLRTWGGSAPFTGTVLYGDFSSWGVKTIYNRSGGYLMNADVRDYWMGYYDVTDALYYNCGNVFYGVKPQKTPIDSLKN